MAALEPLQSALTASQVRIIFISSSTPLQTEEFLQKSVVQFPGDLFSDPTLNIHKLFNLKRGIWRSLVTPLWPGFKQYGIMGIIEGIRLGLEFSHLVGDSWQQGGIFVLSSEGRVMFGHTEDYPGDWKAMDQALQSCGVDVNIDYHAAIQKWLSLRQTRRSQASEQQTNHKFYLFWVTIVIVIICAILWHLDK